MRPALNTSGERVRLERGLRELGISSAPGTVERLLSYASLLRKWNRSYNLVSASDLQVLVPRHLLDSLAIQPYLKPGSLLDVGSGAGLPGLPLALANPALDCTLLDSSGKKIRFLRHVKRSMALDNIQPVQARAQDFQSTRAFDNITCRAFASLAEFAAAVRHLAGPGSGLLAMKGRLPSEELAELPPWLKVDAVERISVPDLHGERHLVIMSVS